MVRCGLWAVNDGEMALEDAMTLAWGEYTLNAEATQMLQTTPLRVWRFAIESADHEGGYSTKGVTTGDQAFHPFLGHSPHSWSIWRTSARST